MITNFRNKKLKQIDKKVGLKFHIKTIVWCSIFTLFFTGITAPFTLLYGPFENAKKIFVGTAMGSMHFQWLATSFLPKDKIDEIIGANKEIEENPITNEDTTNIKISEEKDNSIERKDISDENNKFKGYALIIKDPTRVKIGVSSKIFKEGETISEIAEHYGAVAAINGGYFTDEADSEKWSSNGGIPVGFLMSNGNIIQNIDPNEESYILALTKEGKLLIGKTSIAKLLENKENEKETVTEAMTYITPLIKNGNLLDIPSNQGTSPKTMIGQRNDGAIVFVVLDSNLPGGRVCATLTEAQKVMNNLECYNAVNLDGGKSTTMYLNGKVINNPSYALGERPISSGFIVK